MLIARMRANDLFVLFESWVHSFTQPLEEQQG